MAILSVPASAQIADSANKTMGNTSLSDRQLSLAVCAKLEAQGNIGGLDKAICRALDVGVSVNELKEAFSQLYAYTGFPRSLNALNRLKDALSRRKSHGIKDNEGKPWVRPALWGNAQRTLERGTELQTKLGGGKPFNLDFCPQNDYYLKSHLFGDIFAGNVLSDSDRELVTVAALTGMKGVDTQLEAHKRGAVNMGNTKQQVDELCRYLAEAVPDLDPDGWPVGEPNTAYARYFTGNSHLAKIIPKNLNSDVKSAQNYSNVTFEPGCRNNWHIHHGAHQILICVSGRGWYQEWGKQAVALEAGDIIDIPEGVKHWHGAKSDSWFQHLVTHVATADKQSNEWLEPVGDDEYEKLEKEANS